jgi:Protein of unknown function (DUF3788)
MPANAFIGSKRPPEDEDLAAELGPAKAHWDELVTGLEREFQLTREWNSYSPKAGWALRLKREKRNIVYLSPCRECFLASFALGDRAVAAARQAKLPAAVLKIIDHAKRYAEGTAVRLEVKSARDLAAVRKLATIKLES